ncbi:uncharacterized protein LOC131432107 isoform X2 [Malaya genurostris]|uniref:uncharacterized protein LOC131432107 isoform X2 n=1 Tax=Malaya genurostris TaxID=325434 RepID=UPI0026F3E91E|nr:uncharacterized protein LOC131432107 isoform X2 [Malaya genurostris]
MLSKLALLSLVLTNFSCFSFSLFGDGDQQPLMQSSLEQTLDIEEPPPATVVQEKSYFPENDCDESHHTDSNGNSQEEPDEKIYDLLLKVLQVFDDQAQRDSDRARRLQDRRLLSATDTEHSIDNSDELVI